LGQLLALPRHAAQAILATVRAEDLPAQQPPPPDQAERDAAHAQAGRLLAQGRSLPAVERLLERLLSTL
jgi:hypothetical protein